MIEQEILIHRPGSIKKLDGVLGECDVNSVTMESVGGGGGFTLHFYEGDRKLPFISHVLVCGDHGPEIRDAVLRSLAFHINRGE